MNPLVLSLALSLSVIQEGDSDEVNFADHVAPIVFQHCTQCHRPGEAGPFSLLDFEDVHRRARMIARVTRNRQMPPWPPARGYGDFVGDLSLSDEQIDTLQRWVDAGMPEGDLTKVPPLPEFPDGWQLGEPDLIVEMREAFEVPADGPDIYRTFTVPLHLDEDRWLTAIEVRPSSPALHHIVMQGESTGKTRDYHTRDDRPGWDGFSAGTGRQGIGKSGDLFGLAGWALGSVPTHLPLGLAMRLPKGADLLLQSHLQPQGKPENEKTVIGLHFTDQTPTRGLIGIELPPDNGALAGIDIQPGDREYVMQTEFRLPVDTTLISAFPHAHYICTSCELVATRPGQDPEVLLRIDDWDFDWQSTYTYREPLELPAGTVLKSTFRYDNSADNPDNPFDPPRRIRWGLQSTDEMGSFFLTLMPTQRGQGRALLKAKTAYDQKCRRESSGLNQLLRSRLEILDRNGDGIVEVSEVPPDLPWMEKYDANQDGVIDQAEIEAASRTGR